MLDQAIAVRRSRRRFVALSIQLLRAYPIIAAMEIKSTLALAWRSLWQVKKDHEVPVWARFILAAALGVSPALFLTLINVSEWSTHPDCYRDGIVAFSLMGLCIVWAVLALMVGVERILPAASLARYFPVRDWRVRLVMTLLLIAASLSGAATGVLLASVCLGIPATQMFNSVPVAALHFLEFMAVLAAINWWWWRVTLKKRELAFQAMEAQLRLLQAQVEPHFLFNTLANVQSLIDYDTARAKQMLEAFTDYLRASMGQLRDADSSVDCELGMVTAYLQLLQIRMEDRLSFSIDADEAARAARLPTLLLQPLVENAIHHGLEPKLEGGRVHVCAILQEGMLSIEVEDDGLGLNAPQRRGNGVALNNLRQRLQTRYAGQASFVLQRSEHGTRASLLIPLLPA